MRRYNAQGRKKNAQRASVIAAAAICALSMLSIAMIYKNAVKKQGESKSLIEAEDAGETDLSEIEEGHGRLSLNISEHIDAQIDKDDAKTNVEEVSVVEGSRADEDNSEVPEMIESSVQVSADHFNENSILTWPVQGEVLIEYSMESPVYFQTLEHYGYLEGMVIQAERGEPVYASSDGIVKSVAYTDDYGWTVTVDIGDGYEAVYGQLAGISVSEGDRVATGAIIAEVAVPSRNFQLEGDNVFFELKNNGESVDPLNYLE